MDKYIRKNATFNRHSKKHMAIWNWCIEETEGFKAQNFADFIREKLEWCMQNESYSPVIPNEQTVKSGWKELI